MPGQDGPARLRAWRLGVTSTYFQKRVTHLTALQVLRLGQWSAVMPVHHKVRATTSEEPARPPGGSLFTATGGRRRRLTTRPPQQRPALPAFRSCTCLREADASLRRRQAADRRCRCGGWMSGHRRRDDSTPEAAKSDHMCHPPMKVRTSPRGRGTARPYSCPIEARSRRATRRARPCAGRLPGGACRPSRSARCRDRARWRGRCRQGR